MFLRRSCYNVLDTVIGCDGQLREFGEPGDKKGALLGVADHDSAEAFSFLSATPSPQCLIAMFGRSQLRFAIFCTTRR